MTTRCRPRLKRHLQWLAPLITTKDEVSHVKFKKPLTITLLIVAVLVLLGMALAQAPPTMPVYKLIDTIALPGGLHGFDISWVDPGSQRF